MATAEKDIALILGDGGMMGIFAAGALKVINKKLRGRIRAIYGTSSGADVGVYFISDQTQIPLRFFTQYLTKPDFIRKNFLRYLLKIFFFKNNSCIAIKDYVNVDYVVDVAKDSDCKLNVEAFEKSNIDFYVKVIDILTAEPGYIPAKTSVFEKLKATSQCGPLSTVAIEIDGRKYIDGGTLPSSLDIDLAKQDPDTTFIYVQSQKNDLSSKKLLYPLYLLAGHAVGILYGKELGKKYIRGLFVDNTEELISYPNVVLIKNDLCYSSFCTDVKKLEAVYERGIVLAREAVSSM